MQTDWVPLSASALVVGVMALVFGTLLSPLGASEGAETIRVVSQESGRTLGMAAMYFIASVAMTLGLPAILTLFRKRASGLGMTAVAVFLIGVIGTSGFALLLVFFRALVLEGNLDSPSLDDAAQDLGLSIFLYGWIAAFFLGLVLLAVALFVARGTPVWVPVLLLVTVALFPVAGPLGKVGQLLQMFAMAVAFTGMAIAAVTKGQTRRSTVSSRS
jgi:hypothetical protein